MLEMINSIGAVAGFAGFIGIIILISLDGKDERGAYIQNKFFRVMFFLLTLGISAVIFISSWVDLSFANYKNMVTLAFSLPYFIGFFILLGIRSRV